MGFCLSKCMTGVDFVYDPSLDANTLKKETTLKKSDFVVRLPYHKGIKIHTDIDKVCRICFSDDRLESLENFCDCKGSIRWMHKDCLLKWIETSGNRECRVCNKPFDIWNKRKNTKTHIPSYPQQANDADLFERSRHNRRIYNSSLRNRNVENIVESIGYNPIVHSNYELNLPGRVD